MNGKLAPPLPDSVAQTLTASLIQHLTEEGVATYGVLRAFADTLPRLVETHLSQSPRPMSTAPRGGRDHRILARCRADRQHREIAGRWFEIWHEGYLEPDSDAPIDLGWVLYPDLCGVPDSAFDGWLPLPVTSPTAEEPASDG